METVIHSRCIKPPCPNVISSRTVTGEYTLLLLTGPGLWSQPQKKEGDADAFRFKPTLPSPTSVGFNDKTGTHNSADNNGKECKKEKQNNN